MWLRCRRSIVTLVSHFVTQSERGRVPSAQVNVTLRTHREYPAMAWKFDIGRFLRCNYSIFFEAELNP